MNLLYVVNLGDCPDYDNCCFWDVEMLEFYCGEEKQQSSFGTQGNKQRQFLPPLPLPHTDRIATEFAFYSNINIQHLFAPAD